MSGKIVRCPSCNFKIQIPDFMKEAKANKGGAASLQRLKQSGSSRGGWEETDPTNPPMWHSFLLGLGVCVVWFLLLLPFNPPAGKAMANYTFMELVANVYYKHFLISAVNMFFFTWAMAILYLKWKKLKHQRAALMIDVLPMELGVEITGDNVGSFIDHLYALPHKLRDSIMVNRIRKGLELFETKQNTSDVSHMMDSQSDIDSMRIGTSFILLKAFLWAIPILGFIGTVLGLSHAIGGMNFENVTDVQAVIGSINKVTGGLGTAFDATLLGLVLAMGLNFPMNAMAKKEDDNLNEVDAFCNEVLLPRLRDTVSADQHDAGNLAESLVKAVSSTQKEFLTDLNELSRRMLEQADSLDQQNAAYQQKVTQELVEHTGQLRNETRLSLQESMQQVERYIDSLATGIHNLNKVLTSLGEKQVVVQQVKRKKWFGRE